jgi:hypothetical protein
MEHCTLFVLSSQSVLLWEMVLAPFHLSIKWLVPFEFLGWPLLLNEGFNAACPTYVVLLRTKHGSGNYGVPYDYGYTPLSLNLGMFRGDLEWTGI